MLCILTGSLILRVPESWSKHFCLAFRSVGHHGLVVFTTDWHPGGRRFESRSHLKFFWCFHKLSTRGIVNWRKNGSEQINQWKVVSFLQEDGFLQLIYEGMNTRKDKTVWRKFGNLRKLEELTRLNCQRHLWTRLQTCSEYLLQMQYGEKTTLKYKCVNRWSWLYQWTNIIMCIEWIKATWSHKYWKKTFLLILNVFRRFLSEGHKSLHVFKLIFKAGQHANAGWLPEKRLKTIKAGWNT